MMRETSFEKTDSTSHEVDVIVLGVGTSGEDLSLQLLDAGLDVVGIEPSLVGGECPYWACLPSKIMTRAAIALKEAQRANDFAGHSEVTKNWSIVAEHVRAMTGNWDDTTAVKRYQDRGGTLVRGHGKLTGRNSVQVGNKHYTARKGVVIASGSKPVVPPIPGLSEVDFLTTHDVISMQELPESMIILGGGASGCELGQVLSRFGVKITIIEARDRILPNEEPEASDIVTRAFQDEGITIYTGETVQWIESRNGSVELICKGDKKLEARKLFVTTGRNIDLSNMGLDSVGIDEKAGFLPVNENMQITEGLWAMGDVTRKGFYSHVGLYQSAIIASQILGRNHPPASYHAVPRGTFTDPEVGSVGMTEAQAREAGIPVAIALKQIPNTFRGIVYGVQSGIIKLITHKEKDILIGATVAGPSGIDILGMLNLAVHAQVPMEQLRSMIYAFPSFYSAIGEALGAYGRGLTTVLDPTYEGSKILDAVAENLSR